MERITDAITELAAYPDRAKLVALHDSAADADALRVADSVVRELRAAGLPRERVRGVGRALAEFGTRRNAVALGIVILGVAGDERDRDLLLALGALGNLTLYAAVALAGTQPDRHRALYELAQRVDGWGRIHAVERLKGCRDPEIQDWLLRKGFRNEVLNEYLVHIAATTGELRAALERPDVDDELIDSASDILNALTMTGGPAADITSYTDALPVLARFGELVARRPSSIARLDAVRSIDRLLREPPTKVDWPPDEIARLATIFSELLARPDWRAVVTATLARPKSEYEFNRALADSEAVGVDAYPAAMDRLRSGSADTYLCAWAAAHAPDAAVGEFVSLVEARLPVDRIACGPADQASRLGPDWILDSLTDIVLTTVRRAAPGTGAAIVRAALSGAAFRIRREAARTIEAWFGTELPPDYRALLADAAAVEPDDGLRQMFRTMANLE